MKFDAGKAWPHPVLRPSSYGDDYPYAEFEVDIDPKCVGGSTQVEVEVNFVLSEPDLLQLVDTGAAYYVLLIKAPTTHFRECIRSDKPQLRCTFSAGDLAGKVEFAPFLICARDIPNFSASGWHSDFDGHTFDIATGSVLAEEVPKDYWIDTEKEGPLGSIFGHRPNPDLPDGRWLCVFEEEHVWIEMSNDDSELYNRARNQSSNQPDGHYLINGLYLPALLAVLTEVDQHAEDFQEYQWFASLNQRLEKVGCTTIGSANANRVVDAQKILDSPFTKMPLIAHAENSST